MARAALEPVIPLAGDRCRVRNLGIGSEWFDGKLADGDNIILPEAVAWELNGCIGEYRVVFHSRTARVQIEPDWAGRWRRSVIYREVIPQPREGDRLTRRLGDRHDWSIELVLLAVSAEKYRARSFDRYYLVVASHGGQRCRCWCRWCYSGHSFVPVNDPQRIEQLNREIPR